MKKSDEHVAVKCTVDADKSKTALEARTEPTGKKTQPADGVKNSRSSLWRDKFSQEMTQQSRRSEKLAQKKQEQSPVINCHPVIK